MQFQIVERIFCASADSGQRSFRRDPRHTKKCPGLTSGKAAWMTKICLTDRSLMGGSRTGKPHREPFFLFCRFTKHICHGLSRKSISNRIHLKCPFHRSSPTTCWTFRLGGSLRGSYDPSGEKNLRHPVVTANVPADNGKLQWASATISLSMHRLGGFWRL